MSNFDEDDFSKKFEEECNINRGTGAGGKNCIKNGNDFEIKTYFEKICIKNNYKKKIINTINKYAYYFEKDNIIYLKQHGLNFYLKDFYNIDKIVRIPDEIFIIKRNKKIPMLLILEKKNQNKDGSVIDKFFSVNGYKWQYQKSLNDYFKIKYYFVISKFLEKKFEEDKKSTNDLKQYLKEQDVELLHGDSDLYLENIEKLIKSF
jgi:hypothetical protein